MKKAKGMIGTIKRNIKRNGMAMTMGEIVETMSHCGYKNEVIGCVKRAQAAGTLKRYWLPSGYPVYFVV